MFNLSESYRKLKIAYKHILEMRPPTQAEIQRAYDIFDLKPGDDLSSLDKLWKALARKHHPDLGGDPEKMKEINWAKDILQQYGQGFKGGRPSFDWDALDKKTSEYHDKASKQIAELMKKAMPDYDEYFKKFVPDLQKPTVNVNSNKNSGNVRIEWKTPDGSSAIRLIVTARWSNQQGGALGVSSDPSENIEVSYHTSVYHDGKDYKVAKRSFGWGKLSGQLSDPSELFPEKAMKRIGSKSRAASKFAKRDAESFLLNQLNAKHSGDNWYIPLNDTDALVVRRTVLDRMPAWNLAGRIQKNNAGYYTKNLGYDSQYFPETMEAMKQLKAYVEHLKSGGDPSDTKKFFKAE